MIEKKAIQEAKIIFMYPDIANKAVPELESGAAPKERLNGFIQLKESGWNVEISDSRWQGPFVSLRRRLQRFLYVPSVGMIRDWSSADLIVIKDDFSFALVLLAKLMRKKIVFLDSMFTIPHNPIRRALLKYSVVLSDLNISLSSVQSDFWSKELKVDRSLFNVIPYAMDCDFYSFAPHSSHSREKSLPLALSVGRDLGRDFKTLIESIVNKKVELKIVTLPYLLPASVSSVDNVEVFQRLSYAELFDLYKRSSVAVVPLEGNILYPSGIRAIMESMLLGVPVVATYTSVLAEYFSDGEHLLFVEPGSKEALSSAIDRLVNDEPLRQQLIGNARKKMEACYQMSLYAETLKTELQNLYAGTKE